MIPLLHDFAGERVLVVGGGPVGARRARRFGREAEVVVLAPAFAEADFGTASLVRAAPDPEEVGAWLDRVEPALAVAATDDGAVNAALERGARERGLLVNRADRSAADGDREPGSVAVPATVRDGPVVASVGTGGRSPALAARLREEVEELLAGAGELAELTADLREELREEPPERRREALRAVVASDAVWKALDTPADNPRETARAVVADLSGDPT